MKSAIAILVALTIGAMLSDVADALPDYAWYFQDAPHPTYAWGMEGWDWHEYMRPGRPSGPCTYADMFFDTCYFAMTEPLTEDFSGYHFYAGIVFDNEYPGQTNRVRLELAQWIPWTVLATADVYITSDEPVLYTADFGTIPYLVLVDMPLMVKMDYMGGGIEPKSHIIWNGDECPSALYAEYHGGPYGGDNQDCKVAVHVLPHASRSCTKSYPAIMGCGDIITTEPGMDVDAFPVFFDLVEYRALEFGMSWPGLYSALYRSCSDLTVGNILFPGDGVYHIWEQCQIEPACVPGWAWIWDYGMISIVDHPDYGHIYVTDCLGRRDEPQCNFSAGIGGFVGDDPCEPTSAEPAKWGAIKAIFK